MKVYVVEGNTDLNAGLGYRFPVKICKSKTTAKRLAKGNYVQGTDCPIEEMTAYWIDNVWYCWVDIEEPTKEDIELDEKNKAMQEALERAKAAGLSDDDIAALRASK